MHYIPWLQTRLAKLWWKFPVCSRPIWGSPSCVQLAWRLSKDIWQGHFKTRRRKLCLGCVISSWWCDLNAHRKFQNHSTLLSCIQTSVIYKKLLIYTWIYIYILICMYAFVMYSSQGNAFINTLDKKW